ncbi:hypothetical protein, partial [Limosilactobacillus reuteri]|uniref:hypothetical protein n=1 Tax=Limosilactobacillus reuteri TaxID=1598 RepID=UPI00207C2E11
VLTDRGLTFENAERFSELGNTVTVRRKRSQVGIFTVDQTGLISWSMGAVWFNGGILPVTGTDTGETISLSFSASDHREQRV